jgi:hypothetical protein
VAVKEFEVRSTEARRLDRASLVTRDDATDCPEFFTEPFLLFASGFDVAVVLTLPENDCFSFDIIPDLLLILFTSAELWVMLPIFWPFGGMINLFNCDLSSFLSDMPPVRYKKLLSDDAASVTLSFHELFMEQQMIVKVWSFTLG